MKEKGIPVKSYVIYGVIVVITLLIVFYLNEWYKAYKVNELNESYIAKYVNEVNYDEFNNYVLENPDGIIYIGITNCEECINVEKKLYDVVNKNGLKDQLIFLNLTSVSRNNNYLNDVKNKYYSENVTTPLESLPAIAVFKDRKIVDILVTSDDDTIDKGDITKLLEGQEIIE